MAARNAAAPVTIALLCAMAAAGCGQKGALYLPDAERPVVIAPASTATTEAPPATPAEPDASKRQENGRNSNLN